MLESRSRDYVEAPHPGRGARAADGRPAARGRRGRADAPGGDRPPRHRAPVRRRAAPDPARRADRGKTIVIYGQTEVVKDLIAGPTCRAGSRCSSRSRTSPIHDLDTDRPQIRFRHDGRGETLECDVIAGCDGFHGVCRPSIPDGVLTRVLARVPLRLARHPRRGRAVDRGARLPGARARLRAPQPALADAEPATTSSARPTRTSTSGRTSAIWEELQLRVGLDGWTLEEGPVLEKGVTGMRSFVVEPMQHGRLFLAGDAAHIVPPTGREGAQPRDRATCASSPRRSVDWYRTGDDARSSTATRPPASAASGAPSTSRGG